jgi:hypothetical protein
MADTKGKSVVQGAPESIGRYSQQAEIPPKSTEAESEREDLETKATQTTEDDEWEELTARTLIDKELRGYIGDLPPSVDKLKEVTDRAVQESKELRREARRTTSASNIRRATLK